MVHGCSPRDNAQRTYFGQIGNQCLCQTVGEIFLLGIVGQVFQWKHSKRLNAPGRSLYGHVYASDEAIAAPWQGLDIAWRFGCVSEGLSQPFDGIVNAVIEVNKGV